MKISEEQQIYQKLNQLFIKLRFYPFDKELNMQLASVIVKLEKSKETGFQILFLVCKRLLILIEEKKMEQIRDLADAVHLLPELFLFGEISPLEYWKQYYFPYQKRYQDIIL